MLINMIVFPISLPRLAGASSVGTQLTPMLMYKIKSKGEAETRLVHKWNRPAAYNLEQTHSRHTTRGNARSSELLEKRAVHIQPFEEAGAVTQSSRLWIECYYCIRYPP
ncbi:hypothetical protein F4781DRAFT_265966 [Annulohypoxylon bovei var. microspora]|nr:hypothetical protein F4781DRAFT_265966 [Annulohypoxylon bovei var. microspora]